MNYAPAVDGTRLFYKDWGGTGEPVILIPGQGGQHRGWDPSVPHFISNNRVISFDHRGVGKSDDSFPETWTTRDFAGDVIAILDHLGIDKAHVYGRSMGGRVAQWVGIDNPDRVISLVLGCTSPGLSHGIPRTDEATATIERGDRQENLELAFSPDWLATHPQAGRTVGPQPLSERAREKHATASWNHDSWDLLPTMVPPTLIVHGTDDQLCPVENAALLASRIPKAEVRLVPGARHGYGTQFPDVEDCVARFFARHPASPSEPV
jgi:3-oxoadipate enol-lactonase